MNADNIAVSTPFCRSFKSPPNMNKDTIKTILMGLLTAKK
jgi:hypothetical protein